MKLFNHWSFIILISLIGLAILSACQSKIDNVKLLTSSCTSKQEELNEISVDVPQKDGTPFCLTGLPQKTDKWQWSHEQTVLGFSLYPSSHTEEIYVVNRDGSGLGEAHRRENINVMSNWYLSPDGSYLGLSSGSPSYGIGSYILKIETGNIICSSRSAPGADIEGDCPAVQLKDGRWWYISSGIILARYIAEVEQANYDALISPDRQWVLLGSPNEFGELGEKWTLLRLADEHRQTITLPDLAEKQSCAYHITLAWRDDSRQFAIHDPEQQLIFVWQIDDGGFEQVAAKKSACILEGDYFD